MISTRTLSVPAGVLVLLGTAACEQSTPVANAPATNEPAPVASVAPAETASASPVSERDAERQRAFEEAIAGLTFEAGIISVETPGVRDLALVGEQVAEGERYMSTNQRTEAIKAFATAVRAAPDQAELYMRLGDAFISKGKTEMAAAAYRTASALDGSLLEARVELANTLARDQQMADAIAAMNSVVEIDPDSAIAHERLAIWYYYEGNYAGAWRHVHAQRRLGHDEAPQFVALLEAQMPDPAVRTDTP